MQPRPTQLQQPYNVWIARHECAPILAYVIYGMYSSHVCPVQLPSPPQYTIVLHKDLVLVGKWLYYHVQRRKGVRVSHMAGLQPPVTLQLQRQRTLYICQANCVEAFIRLPQRDNDRTVVPSVESSTGPLGHQRHSPQMSQLAPRAASVPFDAGGGALDRVLAPASQTSLPPHLRMIRLMARWEDSRRRRLPYPHHVLVGG